MNSSPKHSRRRWLPHATWAIILALLVILGGVAPEFFSEEFKRKYAPADKWILVVIIIAGLAAVIEAARAVFAARNRNEDDQPPYQAGFSVGAHNQGAFSFQGGNGTAANTQGNVVGRDQIIHVYNAPPSEPNWKHQLPSPPPDFTGREQELNELLAKLGQGVTISGMSGLGGVGKTALALKLAERVKDRYPDAWIYLDLQGAGASPLTPAKVMEHVIRTYHPMAKLPESLSELSAIYRSTLHGQRALLLMDNARDASQVEPLVPPVGCALLVTSRRRFTLPGMFYQNLDVLPREDAIKLLLNIAGRIGDHADDIARLCDDLPLALRVAASVLKVSPNLAPADYARRLADANQRLSHLKEVDVALNVSYEMLNEEQQRLWRTLSVFPQTFDHWAAAAVWGMASDKTVVAVWEIAIDAAQDALGDLMKWSFLEFNAEIGRYRLHDLARLFAEARLSEAGEKETDVAQRRFALHYQSVVVACDSLYKEGNESMLRGLALFDQEWGNIQAGQAWAEARVDKDLEAAQLCIDYPDAGAYVLPLRQHPREQIHWLEVQLAAARQLKQRESEGNALGNLGIAWADLGKIRKAIGFHEQHLAIAREDGDRRGEGAALTNLGTAWSDLGEMHKAIELYEQRLAIAREIGDRRGEGYALSGLGIAWADLGETRKAIEFYEQQLTITRETGDRRGEGYALGSLGVAYKNLGETRKAIEFYEQVLTIAREIGDRRSEGKALGNLGTAWSDLDEMRKAIEFYEQRIIIACEIGDRRGEGTALWNMSGGVDKLGDRAQAITLAEAALKILEAIEDPWTEKVRRQLAEWRGQVETE